MTTRNRATISYEFTMQRPVRSTGISSISTYQGELEGYTTELEVYKDWCVRRIATIEGENEQLIKQVARLEKALQESISAVTYYKHRLAKIEEEMRGK